MAAIPRTTAQIRAAVTNERDTVLELLKTWADGPAEQFRDEIRQLMIQEGIDPAQAKQLAELVRDDAIGIARFAPQLAEVLDDIARHVAMIDRAVAARRDMSARGVNAVFDVEG